MTLEQYECVSITDLARAGVFKGERPCVTVSIGSDPAAVFRLDSDGERVKVADIRGTVQAYRVVWRPSPLGQGCFPLFLDNGGRPCRKLYRARNGWGGRQDFKGNVLYKSQTLSRPQREGRGAWGQLEQYIKLEALIYEPNRKWKYDGRETPHLRRIRKAWRRVFGDEPLPV